MVVVPEWVCTLVSWLEDIMLNSYGVRLERSSLSPAGGFQGTWTVTVAVPSGETERWFLRKVFSSARGCTIAGILHALQLPTIKPIPCNETTLAYRGVFGIPLSEFRLAQCDDIVAFAEALGDAIIPPLITEMGDRKPANMIITRMSSEGSYRITHIDFDKSLYIPWYDKVFNRRRFTKYLVRRLVLPWVGTVHGHGFNSIFLDTVCTRAAACLGSSLSRQGNLKRPFSINYFDEELRHAKTNLFLDVSVLNHVVRQMMYWRRKSPMTLRNEISRLWNSAIITGVDQVVQSDGTDSSYT